MPGTQRRYRLSDGVAKALTIASEVREMWRIRPAGEQGNGAEPLLCQSVELRSLVLAAILGRNNRNGTLTIPDPSTGAPVILPRSR